MLSTARSHERDDLERAAPHAAGRKAERMGALFVLATFGVGGSETKIVRVLNGLRARGMKVGVAYLNPPDDLRAMLDPAVPVWNLQRRGKFSLRALRSLRNIVLHQQPDVVFAVNLYAALYIAAAGLGSASRPRTVGLINTSEFARNRAWRASFYRPVIARLDRAVYGSESQRMHWLSALRYRGDHSMVLYNGVDAKHFDAESRPALRRSERRRLGLGEDAFVIGTVGRFAPEKNQAVLIDSLKILRDQGLDAHLLLVGDGRLRSQLERRATELGVRGQVIFAGKTQDVRPALCAMDVFVLPSTHVETFSNAALEAMAMRRAVVLSNIGGASEMVRNGVDGVTLERAALSTQLAPVLARLHADVELRRRMGESARARVVNGFSLETMVDGYFALIRELRRGRDGRAQVE